MYISRIVYDGCYSFQDTDGQGSCLPNALFNLTQNYYYVIPSVEEVGNTTEQISIQEN
mgnify:CR=1 FL=1